MDENEDIKKLIEQIPVASEKEIEKKEKEQRKIQVSQKLKEANIPKELQKKFKDPKGNYKEIIEKIKEYFKHEKYNNGEGLTLLGASGIGKSYNAKMIIAKFIETENKNAEFVSSQEINLITQRYDFQKIRLLEKYSYIKMIVLDDLYNEALEERANKIIESILYLRHEKNLPTIITSNLNEEGLKEKAGIPLFQRIKNKNKTIIFKTKNMRTI